jgi:hypothetical protein
MEPEADHSPLSSVPNTMLESIHPILPNHIKNLGAYLKEQSVLETVTISVVGSTVFHTLTNHAGYTYFLQH